MSVPKLEFLQWSYIIDLVARLKDDPSAWLVFVGTYLLATLVWPVILFPIAGGVLFGFWKSLLFNTFVGNVGAWMTFGLSRGLGRRFIERLLKGRWKDLDTKISQGGFKGVFVLRLVGIPPYTIVNYASGLSGVAFRDFALGTFCGLLPWLIAISYGADRLWAMAVTAGEQGLKKNLFLGTAVVLALVIILTAPAYVVLQMRKRSRKISNGKMVK